MRYVKLFKLKGSVPLDVRINKWAKAHAAELVIEDIISLKGAVLVLYTTVLERSVERPTERSVERPMERARLEPLPLKEGAVSPTWEATMRNEEGERTAPVMAGVFPVPEGFKLHPEDEEIAPPVLLAKDADLSSYAGLFGNIKHGEV